MDVKQTAKERNRRMRRLLANSSSPEQIHIVMATKKRLFRKAVLRLGGANDR